MTQEVQPLAWQKRTNLEEHQQFFAKINEIIANLAPTVKEAEAAIATANAASAAASAAASQAQTAASTVAGYDGRLTAAEGDIDTNVADITALQSRMGTAEGKITAIEDREPGYLKKDGAAQTVTSQIMVPTTATGLRDTQIANGTRIQNDLDAYEPMIRNTGNQTKIGKLTFEQTGNEPSLAINRSAVDIEIPTSSPQNIEVFTLGDTNGVILATFMIQRRPDNGATLYINVRNANGTYKSVEIASGDP